MRRARRAALASLLVLLSLGAAPPVPRPRRGTDLDAARMILRGARPYDERERVSLSGITVDLAGFKSSREVDAGKGNRAIAITRMQSGSLLGFRPDGSLAGRKETAEITWLALADLDDDGVAELLTEQIAGRGTGLLFKDFVIYQISGRGLRELWKGKSFEQSTPLRGPEETLRAFLRFEPSGGGIPHPRLLYLQEKDAGGKVFYQESAFTLIGGHVRKVGAE